MDNINEKTCKPRMGKNGRERMDAQSAFDGVNLYITYLVYIFKSPPFLSSQTRIGINRQLFDPSLDLDYPGQNQLLVKHMMQVKGNNG